MLPPEAYAAALLLHLAKLTSTHTPKKETAATAAFHACLANAQAAHPSHDFTHLPTSHIAMSSYPRKTANKPPTIAAVGTPAKRNLSRLHLHASGANDIARVPYHSYAQPVPRRPLGSGPYSAAVVDAFGLDATRRLLQA